MEHCCIIYKYKCYKSLVRWRFACALRGGARGFWFIDPLGLRPRGLCTVATRARHVNHAPPSYNYNMEHRCIISSHSRVGLCWWSNHHHSTKGRTRNKPSGRDRNSDLWRRDRWACRDVCGIFWGHWCTRLQYNCAWMNGHTTPYQWQWR